MYDITDKFVPAIVWDSYNSVRSGEHVRVCFDPAGPFRGVDIPRERFERAGLPICRGTRVMYSPVSGSITSYVSSTENEERIKKMKEGLRAKLDVYFFEDEFSDS